MNPHNWLSRLGKPPLDNWECQYCKLVGPMEQVRGVPCTYEYPPCDYCGETPECAIDCKGIAKALSDPNIYIAGQH